MDIITNITLTLHAEKYYLKKNLVNLSWLRFLSHGYTPDVVDWTVSFLNWCIIEINIV